jgi:hypothetical protein
VGRSAPLARYWQEVEVFTRRDQIFDEVKEFLVPDVREAHLEKGC